MNTLSSLLKNLRNRTPVGTIEMYAGSTAPTDWLICDGSAVSRTTYASLFGIIGTTYGTGDGSTTFNLPDFRGRTAIGVSTDYALGSTGGNKDAVVPYHNHEFTDAAYQATGGAVTNCAAFNTTGNGAHHTHSFSSYGTGSAANGSGSTFHPVMTEAGAASSNTNNESNEHMHSVPAHGHGFTQPTISVTSSGVVGYAGTSGNVTNANMQPYGAVNFIIYAGK